MTCKDCVHYEACYIFEHDIVAYGKNAEKQCIDFKDRSKFIELPCKVGDLVWGIRGRKRLTTTCGIVEKFTIKDGVVTVHSFNKFKGVFGETVFFKPEEAEQALKERNNDS